MCPRVVAVMEAYCLCCGEDITTSTRQYVLNSISHQHLVSTWDLVVQRKLCELRLNIRGYLCRPCLPDLQRLQRDFTTLSVKAILAVTRLTSTSLSPPSLVPQTQDREQPAVASHHDTGSSRRRLRNKHDTPAAPSCKWLCRRLLLDIPNSSPVVDVSIV